MIRIHKPLPSNDDPPPDVLEAAIETESNPIEMKVDAEVAADEPNSLADEIDPEWDDDEESESNADDDSADFDDDGGEIDPYSDRARLRRAEHDLGNAVIRRQELEAALKSAKATEKEAGQFLRALRAQVGDIGEQPVQSSQAEAKPAAEPAASEPAAPSASPPSDNWRAVSIDTLGLPSALAEKLAEAGVENIGQLEDVRAGAGLTSLTGIGRAKADKIEDAVLDWLGKNRDAAVLGMAGVTATADENDMDL